VNSSLATGLRAPRIPVTPVESRRRTRMVSNPLSSQGAPSVNCRFTGGMGLSTRSRSIARAWRRAAAPLAV
jgi:hypothetical protein